MADPDAAEIIEAIARTLSGVEDGLKIPPDKIEKLAKTLVADLGVTHPSMLEGMGSEILTQVFADAYPKAAGVQGQIVRRWFKSYCDEDESVMSAVSSKASKPKKGKAKAEELSDSDGDESLASLKIVSKVNRRELLAKRDQSTTGMSPSQNQAFAASIFAGYVVSEEEVEGVVYGTDIGTTDFARRLKKVDHVTFPKLLAKGEVEEVHDFLINLMRAYSKEGMIVELTTLSQYVTMTDEMFDSEGKSKIRYHKAIGAKYPGRGLPLPDGIDLALVVRILVKGSAGGASSGSTEKMHAVSAAVAKLVTSAAVYKDDIAALKGELRALKSKVTALESGAGTRLPGKGKGDDAAQKPCGYCGEIGHYARQCPKKAADEAALVKDDE